MRVLLIGDSCTDVYVYGDVKRLNPEAPVPILEPKREDSTKGMAWNVFDNLKAFGLSVFMLTNEEKIIKTRYIHEKSNQQILRVDNEPEIKPLPYEPPFITDRSAYHKPPHVVPPKEWYDVMVISDYNKGYVTQEKLFELVDWFEGPVFVDSKKTNLPNNCYVKVNDIEYERLQTKNDNVIITRGGEGTEYKDKLYPAERVNVFDVVGAGDTFLAALTYGYLKYGTIEEAIPLANKAAAVAVSHRGTYILKEEDVKKILC
jgi:D-beta-D-heptose 7-phosphate kinase/D-beta-D-heptose 1-phosphate adenosyltransferase